MGDKGFLLFVLVFEIGRGCGYNSVFPVLDVDEGVCFRIVGPSRGNNIQEARGVRNPFRCVEGPFLGGNAVGKEETNWDMIGDKVGREGPGRAFRELKPAEFFEGFRPRREMDFGLGL
jgi:hypothetical protein